MESYNFTQSRVNHLSDNMLTQLQKLQQLSFSLSTSFKSTATSAVQPHIPPHVQEAFSDFSQNLSDTVHKLSSTMTAKDFPIQERAVRIASQVREGIVPLLGSFTKAFSEVLNPRTPAPQNSPANSNTENTNQTT